MATTFELKYPHEPMDPTQVLKMACPVCGTTFEVRAGDAVVDRGVAWSTMGGPVGVLTYSLEVLIEHTCPPGTTIELKPSPRVNEPRCTLGRPLQQHTQRCEPGCNYPDWRL